MAGACLQGGPSSAASVESSLAGAGAGAGTCAPAGGGAAPGAAARQAAASAFRTAAGPDAAVSVDHDGARLQIGKGALRDRTDIGVTPLSEAELPALGAGMDNVTMGPRRGYRFTPTPFTFDQQITVELPYDPAALTATGMTPSDVRTYYFDVPGGCWRALERVTVDELRQVVVSRTGHFTDMVNAVVTAPEGPEQVSFDPTQIKGMQAANPATGVNQIAPPVAESTGDARLSYPLELPQGRAGLQPSLAVAYSSAMANGWLGAGWDLTVPMISVDTRWGVPRYAAATETETYVVAGEQLTPVAHTGAARERVADRVFRSRVESSFAKIVRKGGSPKTYTWEVTDKSGTRSTYGGAGAVLADDEGNVFTWALREVRDSHGNTVRYRYTLQEDTGVAGGGVAGRNIYPEKITYTGRGETDGPYSVTFTRDRQLSEPRRTDVTIDARGGFKRVLADLLRKVEVKFGDQLVRRYELGYKEGAFHKTLLTSIVQYDARGERFAGHEFGYFDDIRDAAGAYDAFARVPWSSPADGLGNSVVNGVRPGAGDASALGGNLSRDTGGHLYVGVGTRRSKSGSIGVKAGYSSGTDEGLLALVDVDGDTLPDKVFKTGGGIAYRKNLAGPGGRQGFAEQAVPLRGLPGVLGESSSTRTAGIEGYLGGVAAQLDYIDAFTTTSRYFSDVNADGITDLVDGGNVRFGRVGADGVPVYGSAAETPVPIGTSTVDPDGILADYQADRERREESFPLVDSVRRWVAPFAGTVGVTGPVTLLPEQDDQGGTPDGVRVAIQHEGQELWSARIAAGDHGEHAPEGVQAIQVERGDRLYFRVGSVHDGSADQVSWDPVITYAELPDVPDANGLPQHRYTASSDFTLAGRATTVTAPLDGTLHLSGALTKKAATSDDITAVVTRGDEVVVERRIPAAQTGAVDVSADVPVTKDQELSWRIRVDSPVDLAQISWAPRARYTSAESELAFEPAYDVDTYSVNDATGPVRPYIVEGGGTLAVTPSLTAGGGTGTVVFTVKKAGALLAKKAIAVTDGQVPADTQVQVEAADGDRLHFDFSVADPAFAEQVTAHQVTVGGVETPSTLHRAVVEGVFPRPYRGWSVIGYNGNKDRATQPIKQSDLDVGDDFADQLPESVDPQRDRAAFEADPRIKPPNLIVFGPQPEQGRWGAGEFSWIAAGSVASSRLGGPSIGLPAATDLEDVRAVPRISRSQQVSLTGGVGGGVGSAGGSIAGGTSTGELDYLDMNGDGFPDVVGAEGIQYTDPSGVLGTTHGSLPGDSVRSARNVVGNARAGSAARTIATGRGQAAPTGWGSASTAEAGNDMPPLGIGGELGGGTSDAESDLLDINGDGLPDRVYEDGRAALNLGYRFAAPEPWPGGKLSAGTSENSGLNIGFATDFYGFGGGGAFGAGASAVKESLADVNGDGLADRVFAGSPIKVALNTGAGFAAPVEFGGSLSGLNADASAKVDAAAYFRISHCFIAVCVVINPGGHTGTGTGRAEQALRDLDGDGFPDHLASTKDSELTVAANRTGRTNLLRSVQRPLGSTIELDYRRDGNTYGLPESRWVLASATTRDGQAGDGADAQSSSFTYTGGVYDRLNREFLGYTTVVASDLAENGTVYRSTVREHETGSYYTRGLVKRERVTAGSGAIFTETAHRYELWDVEAERVVDGASTSASVFPRLVRTDRAWYEGGGTPGKTTYAEMSYDAFGNVVRSVDHADVGSADDVVTTISYVSCPGAYLVGIASKVQVEGGGALMRSRESEVDCVTGATTRHLAKATDGTTAVTDIAYYDTGMVKQITGPANHRSQRYRLTYTYDTATGSYVTSTTDSFGLRSSAVHDLRFGQTTSSTDVNGQVIRYTHDAAGRIASVTGPHESGEQKTITLEYHSDAAVPYAVTRHLDRAANGQVKPDTIDTITFTDGLGRVIQTKKDATVAGAAVMTVSGRSVFDAFGRVVRRHYPITEAKGAANTVLNPAFDPVRPTAVSYDVLNRTTSTTLPDQTRITNSYGFAPDRAGVPRFESVTTDAKGNARATYADVRNLATSVQEQGGIWTVYAYDPLGQLVRVTDAKNNSTLATYDLLGRRTSATIPDGGTTRWAYDLAGNVIKKTNRAEVKYTYDFDRLTSVDYPVFTGNDVSYTYGGSGAAANGAGRIVKIEDGAGETVRKYGPLGEVVEETRTLPGSGSHEKSFTTGYRYDAWGRVLRLTYPDGEVLSYGYNSGGLPDSATGLKNGQSYPYLKRLDYDKFDQRVLLVAGNGTETRYTYDDEDRRLSRLQATLPTGYAFQNLAYDYDEVGNLTSARNETQPPGPLDQSRLGGPSTQSFTYDNLYRLTSAHGEYAVSANKTDSYLLSMSYDTLHNLTAKSQRHVITIGDAGHEQVQGRTTYSQTYDFTSRPHAPETIGADRLRYDADGNLVDRVTETSGGPRRQQIWDEDNRLACVHDNAKNETLPQTPASCDQPGKPPSVRFRYDDQGGRSVKDGAQTVLYPNQNYTARNQTEFKHVFVGTTRLVTKTAKSGNSYEKDQFYYHGDRLGSTGFGTDAAGKLAEHVNYFPTGETWVDERPGEKNPYLFSGKEFDEETGYYNYGARHYDPRSSLWQSADPADYLSEGDQEPKNLSAYSYAHNNPTGLADPDGRQAVDTRRLMGLASAHGITRDARAVMGRYFEDAVIRSMNRMNALGTVKNTEYFLSPQRAAATGGTFTRVVPDIVGGLLVGKIGPGGVPIPTDFILRYVFYEVKAVSRPIGLDYSDHQIRGLIDAAAIRGQEESFRTGYAPYVVLVSTSNTSFSTRTRSWLDGFITPRQTPAEYADQRGVALWHAVVYEVGGDRNNPEILVGPMTPVNTVAQNLIRAAGAQTVVPLGGPVPFFTQAPGGGIGPAPPITSGDPDPTIVDDPSAVP
ncbi:SpvB/TcaC N-terminal domain-containing protein [Nonomuraea zeae]|uniref:Sugar-binding protein n=1 Tax=Nonomuraea zeae TaxID=1642303 RepID=A0A5S4G1I3_9ACTN|nr:SpvB/TcaC N-terminal domain-containing protein [Nonomuraea zeae]TMR26809.1 sugar-binding protein [Nonomuraea zeae]